MNLANRISLIRILLVPWIVASLVYYHPTREILRWIALLLFFLGIVSDALDGHIARAHNQESQLGVFLDPIADKCLILGTLISLSAINGLPSWMRIPAWLNLIVISREVILLVGAVVIFAIKNRWTVRPSRLGKWTTAVQMLIVVWVLLGLPMHGPLFVLAALLTVASGLTYIRAGLRVLA
jgi:cardiolipin synthase